METKDLMGKHRLVLSHDSPDWIHVYLQRQSGPCITGATVKTLDWFGMRPSAAADALRLLLRMTRELDDMSDKIEELAATQAETKNEAPGR